MSEEHITITKERHDRLLEIESMFNDMQNLLEDGNIEEIKDKYGAYGGGNYGEKQNTKHDN